MSCRVTSKNFWVTSNALYHLKMIVTGYSLGLKGFYSKQ